jgi:DNA polymerase III subunit epsilon
VEKWINMPAKSKTKPIVITKELLDKLDQYEWFDSVPDHLKTKTQLNEQRRVPTGEPKAFIYWRRKDQYYFLFDIAETREKAQASERQLAALAKAKAAKEAKRRAELTCTACNTFYDIESYYSDQVFSSSNLCWDCQFKIDRVAASEWAKNILENPSDYCILDTETTGLGTPDVCAVAVIDLTGEVLLNTLVKPKRPVEEGAREVHGITDEQLADAPGWAAVYPQVKKACRGRKVITYNAEFDFRAMKTACEFAGVEWKGLGRGGECAMEMYSQFVGEWSYYHESYRFQALGGDHTALGDCLEVLRTLKYMAATPKKQKDNEDDDANDD